jgi:protein-L-isoaspartate O-methyltransferase
MTESTAHPAIPTALIEQLAQLGATVTPPNPDDRQPAYCCEIDGPFDPERAEMVQTALGPHFTAWGDWAKLDDGRLRHRDLIWRPQE